MTRRSASLLILALVTVAAAVGLVSSGASATTGPCTSDTLVAGHYLADDHVHCNQLRSAGGRFLFTIDPNGLTIWQNLDQTGAPHDFSTMTGPVWTEQDANGYLHWGMELVLRTNGNLVLLDRYGHLLWTTNTRGSGAKYLTMRPNGRLVLLTPSGKVVWRSNSGYYALGGGDVIPSGGRLINDQNFFSRRNGVLQNRPDAHVVTMQADGNLVAHCENSTAVAWQTNTHRAGSYLTLLQDGALVVKGPRGHIWWSSPTAGWKSVFAIMGTQVEGNGGGRVWTAPVREC